MSSYYTVEEKAETSFFNKRNAPAHIAKRTPTKYGSIPLADLKAKGVWNPRLENIAKHLPKDVWIGGGFLRAMIAGEDELGGDVDFFFRTEEGFNKLLAMIKEPSVETMKVFGYYTIPNANTVSKLRIVDCESVANFRPNLQLVRLFWFDSPEHVIDSFDFTVCQFITDGTTLWFGPKSFEDVTERKLRWHRETGDSIAAFNRILKYQEKGYKMPKEGFEKAEKEALAMLNDPDEMTKHFQQDKIETEIHKHPVSHLHRAWDYLSSAPLTRSAYAKAVKRKDGKPKPIERRTSYNYDGS